MKDFGAIIGFFLLLLIFALVTKGGDTPFFDSSFTVSSSTPEATESRASDVRLSGGEGSVESPRGISQREIEERLADISDDLGNLKEEERKKRLREPASPYQGLIVLSGGNPRETRWSQEYLTIQAKSDMPRGVDITGWYLESYVTKERAKIPEGDRTIESFGYPVLERIILFPGEEAHLISGISPVKASFHENLCTGYFNEEKEFTPYVNSQCPDPITEMEKFSRVSYTNDECYDFVDTIGQCVVFEKDNLSKTLKDRDIKITSACKNFITDELTYDGCVQNHESDPLFDNVGSWYVYLARTRDLWRYEREIIRLLDKDGKVVDVMEY